MRAADRKPFVGKPGGFFDSLKKTAPRGRFFMEKAGRGDGVKRRKGCPHWDYGLPRALCALAMTHRNKPGGLQYLRRGAQDLGGGASGYGAAAAAVFHQCHEGQGQRVTVHKARKPAVRRFALAHLGGAGLGAHG